ncbi:putative carbohydrate-binding protein with CBM5 and CBM33 domain [Pseudomonas protegens]|jgi:predicted carbohydrate-binding protein with CBM5 and CBM33 domain|nr:MULTISPECIES: N-acetylglucosamine-binding protein GbpA [Pseudomonas]BCQ63083.1 GlcNAc-binding protein A [Pseudomonas sp. Boi14]MBF0642998.1 N-acetylglucosamine-binding protein GbpA [Pseudomonas protegens]MBP5117031.1 N-acetylglucosamine-binding protein GbpA [Pseudomonas protegens]MBP5129038.1 N-acetylglucosamine-binding protein GbpA [Pseudomonas protegens]MBP5148913.1 N-acetylglucosamine-binding protein GbpA [Pseudomonas protegens]
MITLHRARSFLKLPLAMAIGMAALAAQQASAHGYIESPKSRAFMCHTNGGKLNANCGAVTYEPQSTEYIGRPGEGSISHFPSSAQACTGDFTKCGPANGTIPAGGLARFSELNEQTATRWSKNTIKPGPQTFTWHYTAAHSTRYWQFYITKKNWNPNQPLTRDSFESTPLLDEPWPALNAPTAAGGKTRHTVNIPSDRSGYHVLLATWKVHDTDATFYQVVDLNIDNGATIPSTWTTVGAVQPEALSIGDKVKTRVFNAQGEQAAKQIVLQISSAELAKADVWPHELAKKVNAAKQGYQMGLLNDKDEVLPNFGKNDILVKKGSDIVNVMIDKEQAAKPGELSITGMQSEYTLKDGKVDLHFNAIAKGGDYTVKATVYNAKGESVAFQQAPAGNTPHFSMTLTGQSAGKYDLVVVATSKKGEVLQQTASFSLKQEESGGGGEGGGKYDHVFPQGLSTYKAGTLVLQPKDGNTYKCKPFPYSGYCVQWKAGATHYEPGTGSHWTMAWDRQ